MSFKETLAQFRATMPITHYIAVYSRPGHSGHNRRILNRSVGTDGEYIWSEPGAKKGLLKLQTAVKDPSERDILFHHILEPYTDRAGTDRRYILFVPVRPKPFLITCPVGDKEPTAKGYLNWGITKFSVHIGEAGIWNHSNAEYIAHALLDRVHEELGSKERMRHQGLRREIFDAICRWEAGKICGIFGVVPYTEAAQDLY